MLVFGSLGRARDQLSGLVFREKEVQTEYNEFLDQVDELTDEEGEMNELEELKTRFMDVVEAMSKTLEMGDVERSIAQESERP